ncbi:HNH endonuclease domain-containing protein [Persephonella sp.]
MQESRVLRRFIERESKYASYKFALLRGVIEIIQEYDHLKVESTDDNKVLFPLGLLIEKWIFYYYPLVESNIPQIYGQKDISFKKELEFFIKKYKNNGGFLQFYNDYRHSKLQLDEIKNLFHKIKIAIYNGPMKHLGYSSSRSYYSIFGYERNTYRKLNVKGEDLNLREYLINNYGFIKFDKDLYFILSEFGSFINGTDSIIFKWALFSANINKRSDIEKIIFLLRRSTEVQRDVYDARKVYDRYIKSLRCVWSDKRLNLVNYEIDHALPFSITFVNDLWNLLPVQDRVNKKKSDKIPTSDLIERRRGYIKNCWNLLFEEYKDRFLKEMKISLTGNTNKNNEDLFNYGIEKLKQKSKFLIDRGYEPWEI